MKTRRILAEIATLTGFSLATWGAFLLNTGAGLIALGIFASLWAISHTPDPD